MSNCTTIVANSEPTEMRVARVEVSLHFQGADNLLLMHATHMVHHLLL